MPCRRLRHVGPRSLATLSREYDLDMKGAEISNQPPPVNKKIDRFVGLGMLVASAAALMAAPLVLASSYSWIEHTTSESGAQGVNGAWMARAGFLLFGFAVFWISHQRRKDWGQPATAFHVVFGISMAAVAAFSLRSWESGAVFDPTEDLLHSVFATLMGFAFAFGVTAVAIHLRRKGIPWRALDIIAVVASVVLPIGMSMYGQVDGILQRLMFAIAYLWYGREAVRTPQSLSELPSA